MPESRWRLTAWAGGAGDRAGYVVRLPQGGAVVLVGIVRQCYSVLVLGQDVNHKIYNLCENGLIYKYL